jgi:glycosyltransferase involved in cell wall biosynthesis
MRNGWFSPSSRRRCSISYRSEFLPLFISVLTVAYLANQFPAAVEPYVSEEIAELRRRGVQVIPGSARRPDTLEPDAANSGSDTEILRLQPVRVLILLRALGLALRQWRQIAGLVARVLLQGKEPPKLRAKALLHTWLGAYYAVLLREREVDHIHVHHGYFGSWIAMVAARLLNVGFSMTLHGSDLLLNAAYLETKLNNCRVCVTISEYNRRYILEHFPEIDRGKIIVSRLGVDVPECPDSYGEVGCGAPRRLVMLAVGRLHAVKDHAFLVRACARLRDAGLNFECAIAGEGPERQRLEALIGNYQLQDRLTLLGHVPRDQMDPLYRGSDLVVLTSRSEGIPVVLMEAMARGGIVLAPAITGIPEIVIPGKTGFLYAPGSMQDLVAKLFCLRKQILEEDRPGGIRAGWIRHAARLQVLHNFNRKKNLTLFGDRFLKQIAIQDPADRNPAINHSTTQDWSASHEDLVLQQI